MQNQVPHELSPKASSSLRRVINGLLVGSALGAVTTAGAAVIDDTVKKTTVTGEKGYTIATPTVFEGDLRKLPSKPKWQPGDPIKVANPRHISYVQDILPAVNPPKGGDPLVAKQKQAKLQPKNAARTADIGINVAGVGYNGLNPPDPTGEVGKNYYVQSTNGGGGAVINIYDKTNGNLVVEGLSMASLQSGDCTATWGDPIIMYDEQVNRWLWTEFSSGSYNKMCVLVSKTDDPINGGWYAYGFQAPSFPDYPKFSQMGGVYYASANESGNAVYAFEREKMLIGEPAAMVRQEIPSLSGFGFHSITPVDVDGQTKAPDGTPGMFIRHRDDELHNSGSNNSEKDYLEIWTLEPNFASPDDSRVSGPMNIEVAEFNSDFTCPGPGFGCLTQKDSTYTLDPLRETVMYKSQYRNFGGHESIIGNFITNPGDNAAALRWFELRRVGDSDWTVYDEGSYTESDGSSRYMAGSALDESGNHLIAYMMTGPEKYPSIGYNGRLASDTAGMLTFGEKMIVEGASSIESDRNGDYSHMSVDPVDNCTFWFTSEYGKENGQWGTSVTNFKVPNCGDPNPGFTLSGTNLTQSVCRNGDYTAMTISASPYNGFDGTIDLAATNVPEGFSASFSSNAITTAETSNVVVTVAEDTAAGNYSLNITGNSGDAREGSLTAFLKVITDNATATLSEPANAATGVAVGTTFSWNGMGDADSYLIEIATDAEFRDIVAQSTIASGTNYRPSQELEYSTTYYWRVSANNACGGTTSGVYSFTTGNVTDGATELPVGTPVGPFSSEEGVLYAFWINVPEGASDLTFTLAADNGDADLYITKDTISTSRSDFICISETYSSNEQCTVEGNVSGFYFALVYAFGAYTDATLVATYTTPTPLSITGHNDVATDEDQGVTLTVADLVIEGQDDPADLTLSVKDGENYTYTDTVVTPAANFYGELSVNVTVSNRNTETEVYALPVIVNPVNDAPMISETISASIDENTSFTLTVENTGATDVEGDSITFMVTEGENYTVDGATISPVVNYSGDLAIMVKANDGQADSNMATLNLTVIDVNDPPVAANDTAATVTGGTVRIDVLANDMDNDEGDTISIASVDSASAEIVDGVIMYTAASGFSGVDTFTYTIVDSSNAPATAEVSVVVVIPEEVVVKTATQSSGGSFGLVSLLLLPLLGLRRRQFKA